MIITKIYTKEFKAPLKTPFITALRRVDELIDVIVVIETNSQTIGLGEGAPTPAITGETIGSIKATINYLSPFLIGKSIEEFDDLIFLVQNSIKNNFTAKSALEIALYNLKAKYLKMPLYKILNGTKKEFTTDITISLNETKKMVEDSIKAIDLGYTILKIKLGNNYKEDILRVLAIKEAIEKNTILRLDANQGWSAKESVTFLETIENKGVKVECIEQPVKADDLKGLKYIKERVQTPILADESVFSLNDAKTLLDGQIVDLINIKLAKIGGITNALKLASLCQDYNVDCMIGCMLEGPISIASAVAVASAKENIKLIDLDAVALLKENSVKTDIEFNEYSIKIK